jgi:hypothetical protein
MNRTYQLTSLATVFLLAQIFIPAWAAPPPNSTASDANGNTVGGTDVLLNNTGSWNIGFGFEALFSNTNGRNNTAIGLAALFANTTGGGKHRHWSLGAPR